MADNVAVTAGSGTSVATDQVGADHYQRVKISDGTADSSTHLKVVAEDAAHTTGDTGLVLMAVRQDSAASLAGTDGDYLPLITDSSGRLHIAALPANSGVDIGDVDVTSVAGDVSMQPFAAILEGGLTELVGINEQVDQNDYSGSVGVALGGSYSGELLSFMLQTSEDGTGAVLQPTGQLIIFDADPTITSGDTSITVAERSTIIGVVDVAAGDWLQADANGATAVVLTDPIPFHAVSTIYFSFFYTLATSINSAAGDDEQLEFNFWYRRDS